MTTTDVSPPRDGRLLANTVTIARRNLLHIKVNPEQLVEMTVQPFMFLVLFVFVFGGAVAGSSREYLQFALPGILVQSIAFIPFTTALGLNVDFQRGLVDRFRSLPIGRSVVISGRIVADGVRVVWSVLIITGFGLLLGFRFGGGATGALGALVLLTLFGLTMCWPLALIGITARTAESVNTLGFLIVLPLTFGSSAFAMPETMPGWLQVFVEVNPLTSVVDATRGLMLGGATAGVVAESLVWLAAITALFAPLTVARYRRRT